MSAGRVLEGFGCCGVKSETDSEYEGKEVVRSVSQRTYTVEHCVAFTGDQRSFYAPNDETLTLSKDIVDVMQVTSDWPASSARPLPPRPAVGTLIAKSIADNGLRMPVHACL
jgi:hypothetical protein